MVVFSPLFSPWRNYCSKGLPVSGELHCRTPDICFVPLAHSAKRLPLKINFISCCLERMFLFLHPTAHQQRCAMAAGGPMAPLQLLLPWDSLLVLLAGGEQQCGCQTDLEQLLSPPCVRTASAVSSICLANLRNKLYESPGCCTHGNLSCDSDQGGRSISFLVSLLLRRSRNILQYVDPSPNKGWMILTQLSNTNPFNSLSPCLHFDWWPCSFPEPFSPFAESPQHPFLS